MGASRVFALLTLASCAEISGLSGLGVDGGGVPDDGSLDSANDTTEPPPDAAGDADASDATFDAPVSTHCEVLGAAATFCADFDEQDVLTAYVKGQIGSWTGHSATKPSLTTTQSNSPPQSGAFDGSFGEWLSFQPLGVVASSNSFHVTMSVRNETIPVSGDNQIVSIQLSPTYALVFSIHVNNASSYTLQINEAVTADGGIQTTSHKPAGSAPNATWERLDITISNDSVMASLGPTISASFNRVQTGIASFSMQVGWAQTGWAGELDDVMLSIN